jgi:hypothetical protein
MGAILYPLINGVRPSFASVEFVFGVRRVIGVKAINYKRERKREYVYGTSPDPLGKTQGVNEYSADVELFLPEWALVSEIPGYGDVPFLVIVNYTAVGTGTVTDVLVNCTIDSTDASNGQGPGALSRKVELNPTKILFNGIDDMLIPLAGIEI